MQPCKNPFDVICSIPDTWKSSISSDWISWLSQVLSIVCNPANQIWKCKANFFLYSVRFSKQNDTSALSHECLWEVECISSKWKGNWCN